ncbi:methyltransferase RsmF C-terminal domain-like protein [Polluticaenibacter yanchengensis]|uniref:RNA methyltransferase n=1 Tax=Polluticaenibacter yanchengensis TaxID=3014562 RepID=A0ABT4UEJ2_9BACT|nr:RNA methyltransferase [Chitinophagaceae bacterium LY-5]
MALPTALLESLHHVPGYDENGFIRVHESNLNITSVRFNKYKPIAGEQEYLPLKRQVPWNEAGYYLAERPSFTLDPLFHAGAYYVQEAGSMFVAQALQQSGMLDKPLTVLDLCAAPGGKTTLIQNMISEQSVLVANEVIKTRVPVLIENLTKWGADNTIVINNDPSEIGKLQGIFDIIVVDAPCSGSGLFRRDKNAIKEWSPEAVTLCSKRQQRILSDIWPALKPGGLMIYSTCSYSREENENIAKFLEETNHAEILELNNIDKTWGIVESPVGNGTGYRFYPDKVDSEGFFLCCVRKSDTDGHIQYLSEAADKTDKKTEALAKDWLNANTDYQVYQNKEQVFAMPLPTFKLFNVLKKHLNIRKAGFKVGDIAHNKLVPDHALALSEKYTANIDGIELNKKQALQYLSKLNFDFEEDIKDGWYIVKYRHLSLGFVKKIGNRFNNYYPKDWRIRQSID